MFGKLRVSVTGKGNRQEESNHPHRFVGKGRGRFILSKGKFSNREKTRLPPLAEG